MDEHDAKRIPCKYGEDCYQKNPEHLKKYKHPRKSELDNSNCSPPKKVQNSVNDSENASNLNEERINPSKLPDALGERIKLLFLCEMPRDFFEFYDFCKSLSPTSPKIALKSLNLELVGPFDLFQGKLKDCTKSEVLRHYRYYYDPPEFQTLLKGDDKAQLHYGYFRDDPKEFPCFVAKNSAAIGPTITSVAGNLFGAVNVHAEDIKSSADIFRKMQIQKIQSALMKWAKNKKITLDTITPEIRARRSKVVAKTFTGIGVVVPYDKKTDLGYRPLAVSDKELKELLNKVADAKSDAEKDLAWSRLQPVITSATIANDECDFGCALELGLDMFADGRKVLHTTIEQLMCTTYKLLQRHQFAEILQAHLKQRKKDSNLNTII